MGLCALCRAQEGKGSIEYIYTEESTDPDYAFVFETVRRVGVAGFFPEQRCGNFWVHTINLGI